MAFGPVRLYHHTCRAGKVFRDEDEFRDHLNAGWVDFPTKIVAPVPAEIPPVFTPECVRVEKLEANKSASQVKPKKPGRPLKKVKGGK